ncbi:MAG: hypothetical protein ACMUHY_05255 [Thermoplasmatota archaeon]
MSDEEELRQREKTFIEDRRNQAAWYESLNLYAEALRIYRSIDDEENIRRLSEKMKSEYSDNARKLERMGKFQEAANLYFLIGDKEGVGRMKKMKPDLVIVYDEEGGGLAQIAKGLGITDGETVEEDYFTRPNPSTEQDGAPEGDIVTEAEPVDPEAEGATTPMGRKGVQVKMPVGVKKMRFCPYCGERINTKGTPKFCPFCGDELS